MEYRNLKAELTRNDLTYKDVGNAIGKSERSIQNKLCDKSQFTRCEMIQIQKELLNKCSIEYLFFEE